MEESEEEISSHLHKQSLLNNSSTMILFGLLQRAFIEQLLDFNCLQLLLLLHV